MATLSPAERVELVLAVLRNETSTTELCRRAQVPESTVRLWRDRFITGGTTALQPATRTKDPQRETLERENARLRTVVADLSVENLVLKKGRPGSLSRVSR